MPLVTIDGNPYEAALGETIFEVARRNGVWIPTLCHHDALESYAACRICMVEIDRGDWWQMVTACNYPVRKDLTVRVESERAIRGRQGVMQLLLARCPESVELADLAAKMGVDSTPYPHVTESLRNCILCGRCIRVCEQRIGAAAIASVGRGVDRSIGAPFRQASEDCIGCGACAAICPVGSIVVRIHDEEVDISPFKSRVKLLRCSGCGQPAASQLVHQVMQQSGGPTVVELLDHDTLCPNCKREKLATELAAYPKRGTGSEQQVYETRK